jgi:segregation and condensation protein A
MSHIKAMGPDWDLDETTEFLVVAATLLDLKAARLLPAAEVEDEADLALLEARDLLFARLLQYRAFKEASRWFAGHLEAESRRHARTVRLEERFRQREPELRWTLTLEDFAALATLALTPREIPTVGLDHLHAPLVSIREQAAHVVAVLRRGDAMTFRELIAGIGQPGVIVARFLAVLELYRHAAIGFEQVEPLGELTLRWAAESWDDANLETLGADYDE